MLIEASRRRPATLGELIPYLAFLGQAMQCKPCDPSLKASWHKHVSTTSLCTLIEQRSWLHRLAASRLPLLSSLGAEMLHPEIFVPPLALAHLVGLCALVYSLESITGCFTCMWRRLPLLLGLSSAPEPEAEGVSAASNPSSTHFDSARHERFTLHTVIRPIILCFPKQMSRGRLNY